MARRAAEAGGDGTNDLMVSGILRTNEFAGVVRCRAPRRRSPDSGTAAIINRNAADAACTVVQTRGVLLLSGAGTDLDSGRYSREQRAKTFRHGGVRKNGITQRRIGHLAHHRGLDYRNDFTGTRTHRRQAEYFIAVVADQRFHKAARFR